MSPIDLDHHATTPCRPEVVAAMAPWWSGGNPASRHGRGRAAADAVGTAAEEVGRWLGGAAAGIVWTSGATEANALALATVLGAHRPRLVTVATEHPSVLTAAAALRGRGVDVVVLPVDRYGELDLDRVRAALATPTALLSVMAVNHEIGTVHPLRALAGLARERGARLHVDAAQGGLLDLAAEADGVDLLTVSAHKLEGPKGVGALWVRGTPPARPGTVPTPLAVGFGAAARLRREALQDGLATAVAAARDRLWDGLRAIPGAELNGPPLDRRAAQNLNVLLPGVEAEALLLAVDDRVHASTGAACLSGRSEPSPVLLAVGRSLVEAACSIRFGLGRTTTAADVTRAAEVIAARATHPSVRG